MNQLSTCDCVLYYAVGKSPALVIKVDGYTFHRNNLEQEERDSLKDQILSDYNIPICRLATNESGEQEIIKATLNLILGIERD